MNNDLISRSELKKAIEQGEGFSWDSHGKDDLCVRKKYIDNAPTVEYTFEEAFQKTVCEKRLYCPARPQGEWIFKHNSSDIWCSVCDESFDEIPQKFNYCPNCGADMREDSEK